jgi:hypothetical protein
MRVPTVEVGSILRRWIPRRDNVDITTRQIGRGPSEGFVMKPHHSVVVRWPDGGRRRGDQGLVSLRVEREKLIQAEVLGRLKSL